ncbi:MAG: hypothetical protein A2075_02655 [Geobacteraceae bacterium GWC2_58_44]|nr:MAG: hypothetical protein A2075_02655 [Geobacteraceae bacterium GWC2_58_44]HBG05183.1 hypothetical protein [Geobacter sp.]
MKKLVLFVVLSCLLAVLGATAAVLSSPSASGPITEAAALPKVAAALVDPQPLINSGKYYLQTHDILAARDQFAQAVAAAPENQEANLLYGVTRVFAVMEQPGSSAGLDSVREIFEASGFSFQTFGLYGMDGTEPDGFVASMPRTGAVLDFVKAKVLPELDGAIANLGKVSNPSFSSILAPAAIATSYGSNIEVDYADALVIKALLNAVKCNLNLLMVYGLDVSVPDIAAAPDQLLTYKKLFADDATFLTAKDPARLGTARAALISFIETYNFAAPLLEGRSGAGHHLFVVDAVVSNEPVSSSTQDLTDIADVLADIRASLDGPRLLAFVDSSEAKNSTVDLSKFFNAAAPINIRAALGNCSTGTMPPDATIGGLFPLGLTDYQKVVASNGGDLLGVVCSGWERPKIVVDPDYLYFNEYPGYSTGPHAVTIANQGTAPLHTSSISLGGAGSGDFALRSGTCSSLAPILAAGASCAVTLDLKRPVLGSGSRSTTLQVASDDSLSPVSEVHVNAYLNPTTGGSISGIVRDGKTGEGIDGARVTLYDSQTNTAINTATTNFTGGYIFNTLNAGSYLLQYYVPPYLGSYQTKWYNGRFGQSSADPVLLAANAQLSGIDMNLDPAAVTLNWGAVWHKTQADGSRFDVLDAGINSSATTLAGMTVKVDGPNGFTYTFTEADKVPYLNGRFSLSKQYPASTPLPAGVYTFTLTDANGNVSYRVGARPAVTKSLPKVDATTIKFQRKADGSYRFSWAPANGTGHYYYRLRIATNDALSTPVYLGVRTMASSIDVPLGTALNPLVDGTAYKVRVEVMDAPSLDVTTSRSDSAFVNFTPRGSDYSASRLLVTYAAINNRTDSNGALSTDVHFGVNNPAAVTSVNLRNGAGSVIYTFQAADRSNADFYKKFTTPLAPGSYSIQFAANGLDHYAYVTLTAPVSYPIPVSSTMQAEDQGNGYIRFSWANVDHTGPIFYRVAVFDKITGPVVNGAMYTTSRQNLTHVDVAKESLGDLSTKQWRVEVYDSGQANTQRNRVNGPYLDLNPAPFSAARPVIGSWRVRSLTSSAGVTRSQVLVNAAAPNGVLSEIRVTGPNGYSRELLSQGRYLPVYGAYALEEAGLPAAGLYTITARNSSGTSAIRYIYQPAAHAVPAVDYRTLRSNREPNGDTRISWAPVLSDVPIWYQAALYNSSDASGDGLMDAAVHTPIGNLDVNFDGISEQLSIYPLTSVTIPAATKLPPVHLIRITALDGGQTFGNLGGARLLLTNVAHNASHSAMVKAESLGFNYGSLNDGDGDGFAGNIDSNDGNPAVYPFSGGNDALALSVKSSSPSHGSTGNSAGTSICATFNKAIDQRTLAGNFTLSGGVAATLSYSTATAGYPAFTACLTPATPLAANMQFSATVAAAVKDPAGHALGSPFTWSFSTDAAPYSSASPAGGYYSAPQTVTLTANMPGSVLYYTTDGSMPTYPPSGSTQVYSGPITVSGTTLLTYFARNSAGVSGPVNSQNYTVVIPTWTLTVQTAGSGSGNVNSVPSGIACVTGSSAGCSAGFSGGSKITLTPAASSGSVFGGWSGACTGAGSCQVTMDAAKSVSASFDIKPASVRIDGSTVPYYSIGGTLDAVSTGGRTVRARAETFVENVIMTSPAAILLKGGFTDALFGARTATSFTVLDGSLKIRQGTLTIERLLLR